MKRKISKILHTANKKIHSMTFYIWIVMMIVGIIPVLILDGFTSHYFRQELIDERMAELQTQAAAIATDISRYAGALDANMAAVDVIFKNFSEVYDVRILLVDPEFIIKLDTYLYEKNKTILSENVLSVFSKGKSVHSYDEASQYIEAVTPVFGSEQGVRAVVVMDMFVENVAGFMDAMGQKTYVIKITLIIIMIFFAAALALFLMRPVTRMIDRIHTMNRGYYDMRLKENQYTELEEFAQAFNETMQQMKTLDDSRQEFVSNVSHELKTPITSMKVLADSLNGQEDVAPEVYREFMQDIVDEIDRESKIIDDLLSLVRLDRSAASVNINSANINELLELILKRLTPIAQKKNVELVLESFRPVVAEVDEVKLALAISNLVENAIKYNQNEGWVHVSLNADHQYFYIRVEDSGIGIPEESQKMVFDRFYRVDKARSRQTGGTGLGLAIVKNCILMHHGDVKLHSEEEVGTIFTVRIPINFVPVE